MLERLSYFTRITGPTAVMAAAAMGAGLPCSLWLTMLKSIQSMRPVEY